ncbi:MAG: leucine-rich repeat domain-containing protein, partial [Clostridia bacterium]|nr:leucine-rich repeat domain-containing protein [Clostridia bacterium]
MKKKVLLIVAMVAMLACMLTITAFAENNIIKLDTIPTLEEIHANPSAYVSHLDAFDGDSYGELDSTSVVVLSDLAATPTYYVFPAYYYMRTTNNLVYGKLTKLNEAIAAADSTAFASYNAIDSSWCSGSCKYLIRYEVPTYVTTIGRTTKFESSTNLKEIYFPTKTVIDEETGLEKEVTCVTSIDGANTFTSCSSLETVHNFDKLPLGIYNSGAFSGCNKLTGIKLHTGITSIPDGMFSNCYKLNNVEIPYGVTYIGGSAFYNCDSITEMILPNTVTTICKKTFAHMDNLEVINFGAGLSKLTSTDQNLEVINNCPKIKYIYMPATFASSVQNTGHGILASGTKVTIFFTGTEAEALSVKTKLTETASNTLIKNATFVAYDPSINYEGYADILGYTILVYNYSKCEAFYNGEHTVGDNYTIEYSGEALLSKAVKSKSCSDCIYKVDKTELEPLFECLGYSSNNQGSIIQGFLINSKVKAEYEAVLGKIEFGVIAAGDTRENKDVGADIFAFEKYVSCNLSTASYDYFDIKITGIDAESYDTYLFFCAYAKFGNKCYYI